MQWAKDSLQRYDQMALEFINFKNFVSERLLEHQTSYEDRLNELNTRLTNTTITA